MENEEESSFVAPKRSEIRAFVDNELFSKDEYAAIIRDFENEDYGLIGIKVYEKVCDKFNFPENLRTENWKKTYGEKFEYELKKNKDSITTKTAFKAIAYKNLFRLIFSMKL